MPANEFYITLELEGLPQENGHVRFNDFLAQLTALRQSLDNVDRGIEEAGHIDIYYRVVGLSYASPVKVVLEPVSRHRRNREATANVLRFHDRYFGALQAISNNVPVDAYIDDRALQSFKKLVEHQDRKFARAIVSNHTARVTLDKGFKDRVSTLLEQEYQAYGTLSGKIDAIDVHGKTRSFWIYPDINSKGVLCKFFPQDRQKATDSIGTIIEVRGRKAYRPNSPLPYRIEVESFDPINYTSNSKEIVDLGGMAPYLARGKSSVEFLRELRDEWN